MDTGHRGNRTGRLAAGTCRRYRARRRARRPAPSLRVHGVVLRLSRRPRPPLRVHGVELRLSRMPGHPFGCMGLFFGFAGAGRPARREAGTAAGLRGCGTGGVRGARYINLFLANAFPEPDLKYFSSSRAFASVSTATYVVSFIGRYAFVDKTSPLSCDLTRRRRSFVDPI